MLSATTDRRSREVLDRARFDDILDHADLGVGAIQYRYSLVDQHVARRFPGFSRGRRFFDLRARSGPQQGAVRKQDGESTASIRTLITSPPGSSVRKPPPRDDELCGGPVAFLIPLLHTADLRRTKRDCSWRSRGISRGR